MPRILVTNDDGIKSPMLPALARALAPLGEVVVVVPHVERSWVGKAISRFDVVKVERVEVEGIEMFTATGTPADCASLGVHSLFGSPPDFVVSGVNLGLNSGIAFLLGSGTVGAAIEASLAGVPSLAFSAALPRDAFGLAGEERMRAVGDLPMRTAEVAADITEVILRRGLPTGVDCLSVNMPPEVMRATPREICPITRTRYGLLFQPADGGYRHKFSGLIVDSRPDGDVAAVARGHVSISPLRLELSGELPAALAAELTRA